LAASSTSDWYVFVNIYARHVLNDIALEGNTNGESHSVDLENNQHVAVLGAAFNYNRWAFVVSTAIGSDQFETQKDDTEFGSLCVTYHY